MVVIASKAKQSNFYFFRLPRRCYTPPRNDIELLKKPNFRVYMKYTCFLTLHKLHNQDTMVIYINNPWG